MNPTWTEERAELAIWLRSYTGTITEWLKVFLEDPDHPVSKTKMLDQLDEWITRLEEYRERIMIMRSDPKPVRKTPETGGSGGSPSEQTEQTEQTEQSVRTEQTEQTVESVESSNQTDSPGGTKNPLIDLSASLVDSEVSL